MTPRLFGLLNINKPAGMTSRDVVNRVSACVNSAKVGHAGTLDPMATGVLVLCLGRATRLVNQLHRLSKTYRAEFQLGRTSDTDDSTGDVSIRADVPACERGDIERALRSFVGQIEQVPPRFSAVHVNGRRAYELARRGRDVSLAPRSVTVHAITLLEFAFPRMLVEIECGSGTYIRSIARDLGEQLGCGALMSGLTRTAVGPFTLEQAWDLEQLTQATVQDALQPVLAGLPHLVRHVCTADERARIRLGQRIAVPDGLSTASPSEPIALVSTCGELLALAELKPEAKQLQPRQVFVEDEAR